MSITSLIARQRLSVADAGRNMISFTEEEGKFRENLTDDVEKYFPKHKCKERGAALILVAMAVKHFRYLSKIAVKKALEIERRRY